MRLETAEVFHSPGRRVVHQQRLKRIHRPDLYQVAVVRLVLCQQSAIRRQCVATQVVDDGRGAVAGRTGRGDGLKRRAIICQQCHADSIQRRVEQQFAIWRLP